MITIKPSNAPTRLYTAQSGDVAALVVVPNGQRPIAILGDKEELRTALYNLADQIDPDKSPSLGALVVPDNPRHIANYRHKPLDDINPAEMIEIFRATPSLASIADEFARLIEGLFGGASLDVQRVENVIDARELFRDGRPVRGAQSRVAQALGVRNAGSYRTRIQAVLAALRDKYSTTTQKAVESARRAA
jgi:hypothetical protein